MRAAYLERLPELARIYGIRPWEIPQLSLVEIEVLLDAL